MRLPTLGFTMASEPKTGALLAALAAPETGRAAAGARHRELASAQRGCCRAWTASRTARHVDTDAQRRGRRADRTSAAIRACVSSRGRRRLHPAGLGGSSPTLILYADAWPGKFSHLDETLSLLTRRRYLLHRRSSAPAELAGRTCAKSDSAHRDARAESRFRDGEAVRGPRPDDGRADTVLAFGRGVGFQPSAKRSAFAEASADGRAAAWLVGGRAVALAEAGSRTLRPSVLSSESQSGRRGRRRAGRCRGGERRSETPVPSGALRVSLVGS